MILTIVCSFLLYKNKLDQEPFVVIALVDLILTALVILGAVDMLSG